ncbi:MAG: hypothetical protein GWN30_08090 [Gammaproteobacteria bacterium]|nr:hypothetical protein [Gammaproteobacteria bacterium]
MKKNKIFQKIGISIMFISVLILAGCQEALLIQPVSIAGNPVSEVNVSFQEPEDILAYRWVTMARAYEKKGLLNDQMDAGELVAYRWNAMAQAFEKSGRLNYHSNPDDLLAYRWNALAQAYQEAGRLNYHDNPDDLLAYRWKAMAQAYEKLGLLTAP